MLKFDQIFKRKGREENREEREENRPAVCPL